MRVGDPLVGNYVRLENLNVILWDKRIYCDLRQGCDVLISVFERERERSLPAMWRLTWREEKLEVKTQQQYPRKYNEGMKEGRSTHTCMDYWQDREGSALMTRQERD